jgi:hypothetical protein
MNANEFTFDNTTKLMQNYTNEFHYIRTAHTRQLQLILNEFFRIAMNGRINKSNDIS